jgi:hypothetical protein
MESEAVQSSGNPSVVREIADIDIGGGVGAESPRHAEGSPVGSSFSMATGSFSIANP